LKTTKLDEIFQTTKHLLIFFSTFALFFSTYPEYQPIKNGFTKFGEEKYFVNS